MVDEAIDGRLRRHGVLEDPIPLAEDEVAGDHDRAPLVALGEEREEDLDLVGGLLDVADVVEDEALVRVETAERARQSEVALRCEKLLDEAESRREADRASPLDEGVADGRGGVRLAAAGQAEAEDVVGALDEVALGELAQLGCVFRPS